VRRIRSSLERWVPAVSDEPELCPCGRVLHYADGKAEAYVKRMVSEHGPAVQITTPSGSWKVPRHYLALHGISAARLPELARLHNWQQIRP
jgi:hypothetical protein